SYLVDSGVVVGKLEINRSLQPILKQSVLIVLVSLFIGLGSFVILRIMPIRIIYRAEKALQNAYDELEIANEQLHREITERKRSEDLYKDLSESSLAAVFIVQDGKFRYINTSAIAYAGYSAEELIDRYSDIVVHPDDKELVKRKSMDMLAGRSNQAFEFRMVTKQNQIRWISQIVTPIEHEGRAAILGNAADVTDLRESRAKMEELMALESSILSSIPHVVLGLQNYNILFVNDVVESIFGWKPAEIIGKSVSVLYNSESEYENYARHMYADVKNQPTSSRGQEVTCRHKDGSNIICRVTCCGIGGVSGDNRVVATYEDITYSKMAHFQLFQSEKRHPSGSLRRVLPMRSITRLHLSAAT
ncbi:MAG: PAS domain S-box protein, partial [Planctomycetaceae bacterium]